MKTLYINNAFFGVYDAIEEADDGLIVGEKFLPYAVIGNYTIEDGAHYPPAVEVVEVPTQITPRQIRQQLTAIGLRQTVEDLISASTDYYLKDWWEYSQDFQRSHPILKEMGDKLGMSESDMDNFFIEASKI